MFSNKRRQKRHRTRLGLPWRRTAGHETPRGGQKRNPSSSCASLGESDVAGSFKCCGAVPSPAATAKNNITMATLGGLLGGGGGSTDLAAE